MIPNSKTRIMVFGTFDVLHKGHFHFFKQARRLAKNPFLIVSVARDENVKKIKSQKPMFSGRQRAAEIRKLKFADKVVIGALKDYIGHIIKEKPAIVALGFDQRHYVAGLKQKLKEKGFPFVRVVRLKPYRRALYRSSIIKKAMKR